jgi:hypothetical protein
VYYIFQLTGGVCFIVLHVTDRCVGCKAVLLQCLYRVNPVTFALMSEFPASNLLYQFTTEKYLVTEMIKFSFIVKTYHFPIRNFLSQPKTISTFATVSFTVLRTLVIWPRTGALKHTVRVPCKRNVISSQFFILRVQMSLVMQRWLHNFQLIFCFRGLWSFCLQRFRINTETINLTFDMISWIISSQRQMTSHRTRSSGKN